jgi:hypothetical protein
METTERKSMLGKFRKDPEPNALDDQIDAVLAEMAKTTISSEEYAKLLRLLERLNALKTEDRPKPISRDQWLAAGVHLGGILIIVGYERVNVITSKAFRHIRTK